MSNPVHEALVALLTLEAKRANRQVDANKYERLKLEIDELFEKANAPDGPPPPDSPQQEEKQASLFDGELKSAASKG